MEPGVFDAWIRARAAAATDRVRAALDGFHFNEAAREIQAFTWGEFCDWYLELSKTVLYDDDASPAAKNAALHTLYTTLRDVAAHCRCPSPARAVLGPVQALDMVRR